MVGRRSAATDGLVVVLRSSRPAAGPSALAAVAKVLNSVGAAKGSLRLGSGDALCIYSTAFDAQSRDSPASWNAYSIKSF